MDAETKPKEEPTPTSAQKDDSKEDVDKNDIKEDDKDFLKIDTKKSKEDRAQSQEVASDPERLPTGHSCRNGWYEIRPRGKLPEKRSHHCSVIHGDDMYIYGGEDSREGKFDSLWKLNLDAFVKMKPIEENKDLEDKPQEEEQQEDENLCWQKVSTTGAKPGPLSHHQAVLLGDDMYIFGGMNADGDCSSELYSLNLTSFEWKVVQAEGDNLPEGRDDHSLANSENALFVFGGFVRGKRMNDLYQYSVDSNAWELLSEHTDVDEFSSEEKKASFPVPRSGHDMVWHNNKIYMFGGRNDYNDKLNDTWEFDIASRSWTHIETEKAPIGRSSHACIVSGDKMILFGGIVDITKEINEIDQFDLGGLTWSSIDDKSEMHKHSVAGSPMRRDKMNETAPVRKDQNELTTMTLKRDAGNKSMKKLHKKQNLADSDEKNQNFHLLKDIPKYNKKKAKGNQKGEDYDQMRQEINTPITGNLRNTFIIKNHNEKFDQYYQQMKRKKGDTFKNSDAFAGLFNQCIKPCDRPTARDGHTVGIYKNRLYVFGGDRHHMPYNDTFSLELD